MRVRTVRQLNEQLAARGLLRLESSSVGVLLDQQIFCRDRIRPTTTKMFNEATFILSLLTSQFYATALLYKPDGSPTSDGNSTIAIGYYITPGVPRAAAIGMAIDQATSEGLLPGYTYR